MNIGLDTAITLMVDKMLPRFSGKDLGLLFTVRLSKALYTDDDNCTAYRTVQLLFVRPSNYTKVFSRAIPDDQTANYLKGEWEQTSDHDSCWRSDGFSLLRAQDAQCHEDVLEQAGRNRTDSKKVSDHNGIDDDIRYVRVAYAPIEPGKPYNFRYTVTLGETLSLKDVAPTLGEVKP